MNPQNPVQPINQPVNPPPVAQGVQKQKNNFIVISIVTLIIIVLGFLGYWVYKNYLAFPQLNTTLSSAQSGTPTTKLKTYTDSEAGFSFQYPGNLKISDNQGVYPVYGVTNLAVSFTSTDPGKCSGYCPVITDKSETKTINGISMQYLTQHFPDQNLNGNIYYLNCIIDRNGEFIFISYGSSTLNSVPQDDVTAFDQILSTFKFTSPPSPIPSTIPVSSPSAVPSTGN